MNLKRLALTPGEPAGLGPDLCIRVAQRGFVHQLVALADPELLKARARALGLPLRLREFEAQRPPQATAPGELWVAPVTLATEVQPGRLDTANSCYVLATLEQAARGCLEGRFDALVTAPVHKGVINDAGIPFSGHTEFLQQLCGCRQVVMMLVAGDLRVALATTHLPLARVPAAITPGRLAGCLRILHEDLRDRFGLAQPRILVCGLNPHAGEGGHLGHEEVDILMPVLEALRQEGLKLTGPLPADTAFTPESLQEADAVLAMYHDQGLPVLKHAGFGRAVNITLGLPLIRTSVDHGTALDLAASGRGDSGSLEAAIELALGLAERHSHARNHTEPPATAPES